MATRARHFKNFPLNSQFHFHFRERQVGKLEVTLLYVHNRDDLRYWEAPSGLPPNVIRL